MLDCLTFGTTWELRSLLWDARPLSGKSGMWCKCNTWLRKLSSPRELNLFLNLLFDKGFGGCATCRQGRSVFTNQQNTGYESKLWYLTSWTNQSQDLGYVYPFFPPTPPFSCPPVSNTPVASWTILTPGDLRKGTPLISNHIRYPTQLGTFFLGSLLLHSSVS
jgi:hypothetical protein